MPITEEQAILLENKAVDYFNEIKEVEDISGFYEILYKNLFLSGFWGAIDCIERGLDLKEEFQKQLKSFSEHYWRGLNEKETKAFQLGFDFGIKNYHALLVNIEQDNKQQKSKCISEGESK